MKSVTCDNCESDLTFSEGITRYRLTLKSEHLPNVGGVVIDFYVYPPIEEDKHFCGLGCLRKWIETQ